MNLKNYGFRFTFYIENNLAKYYLEFIYSDSLNERNFKKEVGNTYDIEHKFVAFSIESENINDFIALAQYLELPNLLKQIRLFFTEQLKKTIKKPSKMSPFFIKKYELKWVNCPRKNTVLNVK